MSLARLSRASFSSLRSTWDGGKNTAACGPLQAASLLPQLLDALATQRRPPFLPADHRTPR